MILADLHLREDKSGIEAISSVRDRVGARVPALLFTGDTGAASEPVADDLRILRKPLDPMRLRTFLGQALRPES
ncbi:MAG: hypothetical protein NVV74_14295 [Magnetospirillum sp.]|nr:hypothetical protein [Magnetospirillum sp.]